MSFVLRNLLVFATITCGVHQLAEGQTIRRALKHIFCHRCSRYDCSCAQPLAVAPTPVAAACVPPPTQCVGGPIAQSCTKTCTTVHPVVETRYRQENFMTCRTECRTAMRQEAYCETVPTTCIENVTQDEGCYQMVWVPKPVTRQVAKTVYQQRMAYRNVPYQYTVQVPQMNTRIVPEQSVRYVQQTQTFTEPMQPVGCAQPMFGPAPEAAHYPPPIVPNCAVPNCAVPTFVGSLAPEHAGTPWTPVQQRAGHQPEPQGANYLPVTAAAQMQPQPTPVQQQRAQLPQPTAPVQQQPTPVPQQAPQYQQQTVQTQQQIPTAAAVWQTQR
jgi:hypothetical protein